jgi:hypothetical protein
MGLCVLLPTTRKAQAPAKFLARNVMIVVMILIFVEANLRNCEESGPLSPSLTKVTLILDNSVNSELGFFQRSRPRYVNPIFLFEHS